MRKQNVPSGGSQQPDQAAKTKKQKRDIRWDKLDNTAHLFPVIAGERMSSTYRISVTLTELVDRRLLQQALDLVLPRYEAFDLRLRRGVFWYYFEENGKPAPRVDEEISYPCRYIRSNRNNNYMFCVSCYKYRINLEVFHVLTDGMGGISFLKELTFQYLRLVHPELVATTGDFLSNGVTLNREDSFIKNYRHTSKNLYRKRRAFLIRGEHLRSGQFGVMHGYMDLPQLKAVCRRYGASINEYLVSAFIWSIYTEYNHQMDPRRPISIAVPVNLRPYFNSITSKNFFVMVSAEFCPPAGLCDFQQVLAQVRQSLSSQIERDRLEQIFSYNVSSQKSPWMKRVPLPVKNLAMRHVYTRSALANTATVTNVGSIQVPDPYKPYIQLFHAFLAISKGQPIKGTICSYGDTLVFSFSYDLVDPSVQRGFFRKLADDGLKLEIESNGVHYE